ncbi:690_t:CDS:2, partial [Gigaspora margarita]
MNFNACDDNSETHMLAYSHEVIGSPKNTILRPLQACYSFDIHNEQPDFFKDTVILSKSVRTTELGLEDMRALSKELYKTFALR